MIKMNFDEVVSLVSQNTGITKDKLKIDSCSQDFDKWDSIAHVRIMLDLEKKTKSKISTSQMENLDSIKKIINYFK
jgi:acyl carrier protein